MSVSSTDKAHAETFAPWRNGSEHNSHPTPPLAPLLLRLSASYVPANANDDWLAAPASDIGARATHVCSNHRTALTTHLLPALAQAPWFAGQTPAGSSCTPLDLRARL